MLDGVVLRVCPELPGTAAEVVAAVQQMEFEGVVAKRRDSFYEPGDRSSAWVKLKLWAIERHAGFTVRQWLAGLLEDQDLLTSIEGRESLGEFGEKTEKVGREGEERDAGIFEYRGAQTEKIPVSEWLHFALEHFELILKLHGH